MTELQAERAGLPGGASACQGRRGDRRSVGACRRGVEAATGFVAAVGSVVAVAQPAASQVEWPCLGGDPSRSSTRARPVGAFTPPRWTLGQTAPGQPISFTGPAGVAATVLPAPRLFATAVVAGQPLAMAIDAETGGIVWTAPIPGLVFDSWSSPALDAAGGVVIFATGSSVIALRISDGSQAWRTDLAGPPVSVSPLVTRDLGAANRAFVTDYGGFGSPSWLYCINVSPRHPALNLFDPGQLVWAAPIGSATGATPAYLDGIVYVCGTGADGAGFGQVRAFDARAVSLPTPLWTFTNPVAEGFFGGLTVREAPGGPFLYAATFSFFGQLDSANLVKIDARSGALVWSVPSNRTSSIPVVLDDGRIALSSGIDGFGSVPMVQMFRDDGGTAVELWNTATSTWNDANSNGVPDLGEFLLVGGWTTQPVLTRGPAPGSTPRLIVGSISTGGDFYGPYTALLELDLSKSPGQAGFVAQQTSAAGSTPAMLGSGVYSIGTQGLAALGPPPPRPDANGDGAVTVEDLYAWERAPQDIDRDGAINASDAAFLSGELRRAEARDMRGGRR